VRRLGLCSSFAQTNIVRANYAVGADEMRPTVSLSTEIHRLKEMVMGK
jgi:hypothetical protein